MTGALFWLAYFLIPTINILQHDSTQYRWAYYRILVEPEGMSAHAALEGTLPGESAAFITLRGVHDLKSKVGYSAHPI